MSISVLDGGRVERAQPAFSARMFRAGNIYCCRPVIRMEFPSESAPREELPPIWLRQVADALPPHRPDTLDFPGWPLIHSASAALPFTSFIEIVALMLQRSLNLPVSYFESERSPKRRRKIQTAIFETRFKVVGVRAGEAAVGIYSRLMLSPPSEFGAIWREAFGAYIRRSSSLTPKNDTMWLATRAEQRGICWSPLLDVNFLRLGRGRYSEMVHRSDTSLTSCVASQIAHRKHVAQATLKAAGLPVAEQRRVRSAAKAVSAARQIGFPVVVKPALGSGGRSVAVGLMNEDQITEAFLQAQTVSRDVVVESMINGDTFRLTVIGGRFFAAAQRHPPQLRGDGASTVLQLVERENKNPERQPLPAGLRSLKPIEFDDEMLALLAEQGLSPEGVPESSQIVLLRRAPNPPFGEKSDVTERVHPSIREVAERAAALLKISVCGLDFVTTDIGRPYWDTGGAICEINNMPTLGVHRLVSEGTPRDGADAVLDILYPPGKRSTYPVIVVLTESADIEQALSDAFSSKGCKVGLLSDLGASRGWPVDKDLGREERLQALELDGSIDVAIISLSEREMIDSGVGLAKVDVVIAPAGDRSKQSKLVRSALSVISDKGILLSGAPDLIDRTFDAIGFGPFDRTSEEVPRQRYHENGPLPLQGATSAAEKAPGGRVFTVLLVGDIGFGESYTHRPGAEALQGLLTDRGYGHSLDRLRPLLASADMRIGNLEVPLAAVTDPGLPDGKRFLGWSDPERTTEALQSAGFDALSLANNHILDCGIAGLHDTMARLEAAGIAAFGAGPTRNAADKPLVRPITVGGIERMLVIFGRFERRQRYEKEYNWYAHAGRPGVSALAPGRLARQIGEVRRKLPSAFIVVFPHWGVDYGDISPLQRRCATALMEAGADLIVGHGTHSLQTVEIVLGRPVVYGLGNFVWNSPGRFGKSRLPYGMAAALRFSEVDGDLAVGLRLYPLAIDNRVTGFQNRPVSPEEFATAAAAATLRYSGEIVREHDDIGHYLEIPISEARSRRAVPRLMSTGRERLCHSL